MLRIAFELSRESSGKCVVGPWVHKRQRTKQTPSLDRLSCCQSDTMYIELIE
jgi:predicted acyl esterase